jgi:hypothetical protein
VTAENPEANREQGKETAKKSPPGYQSFPGSGHVNQLDCSNQYTCKYIKTLYILNIYFYFLREQPPPLKKKVVLRELQLNLSTAYFILQCAYIVLNFFSHVSTGRMLYYQSQVVINGPLGWGFSSVEEQVASARP